MKTSKEWWDDTKSSPEKLINWLKNQYHGEATASTRIKEHILPHMEGKYKFMVEKIADDEDRHAKWVGELLETRGFSSEVLQKEERYWNEVLTNNMNDPKYAAAVAAHAEEMRLERIIVISEDETAPSDIRKIFEQILKDEQFHAKAFKLIAGDDYYNNASESHAKGLEALGLII